MPRVSIVRTQAQQDRVSILKSEARDLVVETAQRPGNHKLLRAIAFILLDQMAEMPGAELRLRNVIEGLERFSQYKANRKFRG